MPNDAIRYTLASDLYPPQARDPATLPPFRLYLDRRELSAVDLGEPMPSDAARAEHLLRALLVGSDPGTIGRVDALTYPERRGAHAYAATVRLVVYADGGVREAIACGATCPCDGR